MYFDFEDYRPDITPIGSVIPLREGVLLAIAFQFLLGMIIWRWPSWFPEDSKARAARVASLQQQLQDQARFVFVQPRVERKAPKPPPPTADLSDRDRLARSPERAPKPTNPLPFSRGNSFERVDEPNVPREVARGRGPQPEPAPGQNAQNQPAASSDPAANAVKVPESQSALQLPPRPQGPAANSTGRGAASGGSLGDALRNLQRYVQGESFDNQGGSGQFGPEIQFDTKGVEFGPWIRRFIAQVKRNWFIPYAAMSQKGHVVITFNVHKDGSITDLSVVGPSPIDPFNNAAFGALASSNPTQPLPPEYPADKAFFTVTFFYNETPAR
jgi:TonB family protein